MKTIMTLLWAFVLISCMSCEYCGAEILKPESLSANQNMYVIERNIPGSGNLTPEELTAISRSSCNALRDVGVEIHWLYSYVAVDKLYCVYTAPNEEMVREHAKQGGFTVDLVSRVSTIIGPSNATK